MANWKAHLTDTVTYCSIEVETKDEAIQQALEWWSERMPYIKVEATENVAVAGVEVTSEIEKVITQCPRLKEFNRDCDGTCPLCEVCRAYWYG